MPPNTTQKVALSPTNPEPLASLRIWGAQVELGDVVARIPALDASRWLEVLLAESIDPELILPGFCDNLSKLDYYELLLNDKITSDEAEQAFLDVLEAVSGRRWWITLRLCRALRNSWETVGGMMASRGISPAGMSLSYWLDGAYATMVEALVKSYPDDLKRVASFTHTLTLPPPSVARQEADEVANSNAFLAAMKMAR